MSQDEVRDGKPGVDAGRRKLFKAAAVAGGAVAAVAALPGEWKKPLATVGGLPAHAQTSGADITLRSVLVVNPFAPRGVSRRQTEMVATFSYEDPLCEIDETATIWVEITGPEHVPSGEPRPCETPLFDNVTLESIGASISPDPCAGNISFLFEPYCGGSKLIVARADVIPNNSSISIRLSKGARHSNIVTAAFSLEIA